MPRPACYLLGLWIWLAASAALAQPAQWSPLLQVNTLAGILDGPVPVRVIHVTGDAGAGVIPGAVRAPYSDFRGPGSNAGQLPPMQALQALLQQLGIDAETPVVVVHQGSSASDFGAATRVYWTLKSLGVQHLAVLNGGFQQWQAAGLPVSMEPAVVPVSRYQPLWQDTWRLTSEQVADALADDRITLLDSRPAAFYLGQQSIAAQPGTIRGAENLSFATWFDGNQLKPLSELQQLLSTNRPVQTPTTVAFCNTGHWASINWFVLSELLGVSDTRLYAESVVEWAQQARPMDNQPGRLAWYWDMTRDWWRQITDNQP
ncbi:sulfurtransferase [Pseudohongiella sp.]|uniref:Rhodanese domain-containing protein n=1 Tax=marine sediment metagenome TaxID=412755 RepID=A0A0F9Z546_9ZZZZ|nr:rhodanese-like domain-containing protein [Pseudohongiella sp.]HDZ07471.1 sulfurtransferase [Pseudohongiella sp.]HEA63024.1 sulfurtransferase [Pseudohongiella sp.]